ncbi:MAG: HNH endonuclease [Deltaproteobacteria bacterium]|nr:HNH endonuclease [Deltaproteobacteria bacterium]
MKFEFSPKGVRASDEEMLADIVSVAKALGRDTLAYNEYSDAGKYGADTVRRRFGSWNNAIKRAGLKILKIHGIPDEQLFENLQEIWIRLGRQPSRDALKRSNSKFGSATYEARFGTWNKALMAFVAWANKDGAKMPAHQSRDRTPQAAPRSINLRLRFLVMKRDDFKCQSCGHSPATHPNTVLHIDHIQPWSKGGSTDLKNLQTLCSNCNLGKGDVI